MLFIVTRVVSKYIQRISGWNDTQCASAQFIPSFFQTLPKVRSEHANFLTFGLLSGPYAVKQPENDSIYHVV